VKGFWTTDEVADVVDELCGFRPEVSTSDDVVIIHPRPRELTEDEVKVLEKYFKGKQQKTGKERDDEEEVAEESKRAQLRARIAQVDNVDGDIRDGVRALAEWLEII